MFRRRFQLFVERMHYLDSDTQREPDFEWLQWVQDVTQSRSSPLVGNSSFNARLHLFSALGCAFGVALRGSRLVSLDSRHASLRPVLSSRPRGVRHEHGVSFGRADP